MKPGTLPWMLVGVFMLTSGILAAVLYTTHQRLNEAEWNLEMAQSSLAESQAQRKNLDQTVRAMRQGKSNANVHLEELLTLRGQVAQLMRELEEAKENTAGGTLATRVPSRQIPSTTRRESTETMVSERPARALISPGAGGATNAGSAGSSRPGAGGPLRIDNNGNIVSTRDLPPDILNALREELRGLPPDQVSQILQDRELLEAIRSEIANSRSGKDGSGENVQATEGEEEVPEPENEK